MRNQKEALEEIRVNVEKLRAQKALTPTEAALFGVIDGLATLVQATTLRVADLERRVGELTGQPVVAAAVRPGTPK